MDDQSSVIAPGLRAAISREIHHRVKNNLQIVASLISLYARGVTDPDAQNAFRQILARVDALALIQRLAEKNTSSPVVEMKPLFDQLADQIRSLAFASGRIYQLTLDVEDRKLPADIATPIVLFAVEALSFELFRHDDAPRSRTTGLHFASDGQDHVLLQIDDPYLATDRLRAGTPSPQKLLEAFALQLKGNCRLVGVPPDGCRLTLRAGTRLEAPNFNQTGNS